MCGGSRPLHFQGLLWGLTEAVFWHLPENLAHSDLLGLAGVKSLGKTTPQPSGTLRHPAIMVEGVIVAGAFPVFLMRGEEQLCQESVCMFAFLHACSQCLRFLGIGSLHLCSLVGSSWNSLQSLEPAFCTCSGGGWGIRGDQEPVSAF